MRLVKLKKYASLITVPAVCVIIFHLVLLLADYRTLSRGEGWGVVYVFGALFWSIVILSAGVLIRLLIKPLRTKLIIEISLFIFLVLFVIVNL